MRLEGDFFLLPIAFSPSPSSSNRSSCLFLLRFPFTGGNGRKEGRKEGAFNKEEETLLSRSPSPLSPLPFFPFPSGGGRRRGEEEEEEVEVEAREEGSLIYHLPFQRFPSLLLLFRFFSSRRRPDRSVGKGNSSSEAIHSIFLLLERETVAKTCRIFALMFPQRCSSNKQESMCAYCTPTGKETKMFCFPSSLLQTSVAPVPK